MVEEVDAGIPSGADQGADLLVRLVRDPHQAENDIGRLNIANGDCLHASSPLVWFSHQPRTPYAGSHGSEGLRRVHPATGGVSGPPINAQHSDPVQQLLAVRRNVRIERPRRRAGQRFRRATHPVVLSPGPVCGSICRQWSASRSGPAPDPRRGSRPPILVAVGSLDGDGPRSSPPGPPARVRRSGSASSASSVAGRRRLRCSISSTSRSSPFLRPRPGLPGREALRWVDHAALVICELGSHGEMAEKERPFVELLSAQPSGHFVAALAGVACPACGNDVVQGAPPAPGNRQTQSRCSALSAAPQYAQPPQAARSARHCSPDKSCSMSPSRRWRRRAARVRRLWLTAMRHCRTTQAAGGKA